MASALVKETTPSRGCGCVGACRPASVLVMGSGWLGACKRQKWCFGANPSMPLPDTQHIIPSSELIHGRDPAQGTAVGVSPI
jgi:hypothetical protein